MIIVARTIGLVLFGLGMIVLEFRAFSEPWEWTLAQDIFALAGLSILLGVLWSRGRGLLHGATPLVEERGIRRAHLRNLLLWMMIAAALTVLYNIIWHG
jgi:hypothetical protein